jgi:hypothetical protein
VRKILSASEKPTIPEALQKTITGQGSPITI